MLADRLIRILAAFAMLLMPLAMAGGVPAAAAAAPHHAAAAASEGHCSQSGEDDQDRRQGAAAHCTMACAALPAWQAPLPAATPAPRPSVFAGTLLPVSGLAPEAETPPPRTA